MNLQQSSRESGKKYTVKSTKTEDYSETNKRPKEELAREIIHALDDGMKYLRGEVKGRPIDELLDELDKYVAEERKNG